MRENQEIDQERPSPRERKKVDLESSYSENAGMERRGKTLLFNKA